MKPQFTAKIGTSATSFNAPTMDSAFKAFSCLAADAEENIENCSLICHGSFIDATIQMAQLSDEMIEWGWNNNFPEDACILDDEPADLWDEPADDGDGLTKEMAQEIEAMIIAERDGEA